MGITASTSFEVTNEYVKGLYKLLVGSWEEGAAVRDRANRVFSHQEKVHESGYKGRYFEVPGYHLSEAAVAAHTGALPGRCLWRGQVVCGAPCRVRVCGRTQQDTAQVLCQRWEQADHRGRTRPEERADLDAGEHHRGRDRCPGQAKFEEYERCVSCDGALVYMSGWTGFEF